MFVVVPGWEYPAADSGLAIVAPQAEAPAPYENSDEAVTWTSKGGKCDSPEDAWEMIPECVRETLCRSLRHGFYATKSDLESESVRPFDVTIDSEETYETIREPAAEFCLWRSES